MTVTNLNGCFLKVMSLREVFRIAILYKAYCHNTCDVFNICYCNADMSKSNDYSTTDHLLLMNQKMCFVAVK